MQPDPSLSPDGEDRLNQIRDDFERQWLARQSPKIEQFLQGVDEASRPRLLRELLLVELRLRHAAGDEKRPDEYLQRFSAHAKLVQELLSETVGTPALSGDAETVSLRATNADGSTPTGTRAVPASFGSAGTQAAIGRYRIERELGKGGFGQVLLAYDEELNRRVAIKIPRPDKIGGVAEINAYLDEARTVAGLDHPRIVPVYDVGRTDWGSPYVVSKFIEGSDLAHRIQLDRPSIRDSVVLIAALADALHYAHSQGLVHRDIKPQNILLDQQGQGYLCDFGLAMREETYGQGPRLAGTPEYMSPEQARGEGHHVDGRSDIFSLGIVLYELLTGAKPFRGSSWQEVLEVVEKLEPKPPRQYCDAIPRELERICLKALSKRPSDRYSCASDLAEDLRRWAAPRAPIPPYLAALLAIMLVPLAIWWTFSRGRQPIVSNPDSATPTKSVGSSAAESVRITDFDITHFARIDDGTRVETRGIFGKTTWSAKQRDLVTLDVRLNRPAYAYLLAFRPDGVMELCYPEETHLVPPLSAEASYPSEAASRTKAYGLSESPGLWIFTAVVSERPLPAFQEWSGRHQLPAPTSTHGLPGIVLVDDGQSIDRLHAAGRLPVTRGKGEEIPGQRTLETIDNAIKRAIPHAALRSVGITAEPET